MSPLYFPSSNNINSLQFELERNREKILQLRTKILEKENEISKLKVQKNKKDEEHQKLIRTVDDILKYCDKSTTTGFKAIEFYLHTKMNKTENINELNSINILDEEKFDEIREMIHLNDEQINTLKELVYISSLKEKVNILNEEINKKDNYINEIKKKI